MAGFERWEVIYDWAAENEDDLALVAGEIVLVKEKHEHGWWFGVIERGGTLFKGHFPKNYVKQCADEPPPPPPVRPASTRPAAATPNALNRISRMFIDAPSKEGQQFSLRSMQAFDELLDIGVALEIENFPGKKAAADCEPTVSPGSRVTVEYVAMIWDGSEVITREFSRGQLSFTVDAEQVVKGLDLAIQRMKVGESATVTCAPAKAYGSAGNPPHIAPETYLVYKLRLTSAAKDTAEPATPAAGPDVMLGAGIGARVNKTTQPKKAAEKGLVLDQ